MGLKPPINTLRASSIPSPVLAHTCLSSSYCYTIQQPIPFLLPRTLSFLVSTSPSPYTIALPSLPWPYPRLPLPHHLLSLLLRLFSIFLYIHLFPHSIPLCPLLGTSLSLIRYTFSLLPLLLPLCLFTLPLMFIPPLHTSCSQTLHMPIPEYYTFLFPRSTSFLPLFSPKFLLSPASYPLSLSPLSNLSYKGLITSLQGYETALVTIISPKSLTLPAAAAIHSYTCCVLISSHPASDWSRLCSTIHLFIPTIPRQLPCLPLPHGPQCPPCRGGY